MNNYYHIPDMTSWSRPMKLDWHMRNPQLSNYMDNRSDLMGWAKGDGFTGTESDIIHILVNIADDGNNAFNLFCNYCENAHPMPFECDSDDPNVIYWAEANANFAMVENKAYPIDLVHEAFTHVCNTLLMRDENVPVPDDLPMSEMVLDLPFDANGVYDPLWWVQEMYNLYMRQCNDIGEHPFLS